MASSRKTPSRSAEEVDDDPERENKTRARGPKIDPERANKTQARPRPSRADDDPERANSTQARARPPTRSRDDDPERNNSTQARVRAPREAEFGGEDDDYKTGRSYAPSSDDLASVSLDGDGLDALEPDMATSTKALAEIPDDDDSGGPMVEDEPDDENATRAGNAVKLEIVAGPDKGRVKKFKGVRMVIGRTPGVDLQLSDQSVSRRHIELVQDDGVVSMRDLGSGNGTKVNGVKIAEKKLEHGDEISIGKTRLRFVDEVSAFKKMREEAEKREAEEKARAEEEAKAAAAAEAAEAEGAAEGEGEGDEGAEQGSASSDRSRPVRTGRTQGEVSAPAGAMARWQALNPQLRLVIVGFAAVAVVIFIAGLVFRPGPPAPVDTSAATANQKMQDARAAMKNGDYETSIKLIEEAEKLVPGIDKGQIINSARQEFAFATALDEARSAIKERKFEDARKALDRAGKGSIKSEELKAQVQKDLDAAEIVYKREKIDDFITAGEIEAAKTLLNELPLEQRADSEAKVIEYERVLAQQQKQDELDARRATASRAAAAKAAREEEVAAAFATVERKFAGGEWERASSECARVIDVFANDKEIKARARQLQADIPAFGRAYDEGMKKYRANQQSMASRPLREAWRLYGRMHLRANQYGPEIESKLGESSLAAGREALIHDDIVSAYANFKDAIRFDPSDPKAREGLLQVESKAQDMFEMAYGMKDSDPQTALRKFKIVVQVTDAQSPVHERAKNNIAAMQP